MSIQIKYDLADGSRLERPCAVRCRTLAPDTRLAKVDTNGAMEKWPPLSASTILAKTLTKTVSARLHFVLNSAHLGESKYGIHMDSIEPSMLTIAAAYLYQHCTIGALLRATHSEVSDECMILGKRDEYHSHGGQYVHTYLDRPNGQAQFIQRLFGNIGRFNHLVLVGW